jgi:hypothetical protein
MNRTLKWILYVILGLVGLAVLAGIVMAIFGGYRYSMMGPGVWMAPHMRVGFNPVRWIFGAILGFGVFLLVILGIIALIASLVRGNRPYPPTTPTTTATPPPAATATKTCPNCGRIVQEDWKNCPYCGTPLT